MSKCSQCNRKIPHYFLGVIPLPKMKNEGLGENEKLSDIKSRYYVGSGHGMVAEDNGAVCCGCDSGIETIVFCRCPKSNNHNNYEKYPDHCFWRIVPSSFHKLGRKERGD